MNMMLPPEARTDVRPAEHPDKLDPAALGLTDEQWGEGEGYVEYLTQQREAWCNNPPPAPHGFQLIQCDAEPRHWPTYTVVDHDFYEPPCPHCQYAAISHAHSGCEHSHHRPWRRWRITHKIEGWAYSLGIVAAGGTKWGGGCRMCLTHVRFKGKRVYVLGRRTEWWACLLKRHHWPTKELVAFGMCSKCLPCPDCGSGEAWHQCTGSAS